ncbi:nitrate- and nitrite sensing domain-containing protein [Nonomuraea sp. CA-218870]|uniref:nitrate- and nitrite sensing domain-containing protein n=1 Tax=Nonomuraea sp. CA-218870 TaxID=3239998 RepID=UPI003D8CDB48
MSTELAERPPEEGRWRLRNWRVRARLVALILVPTAAAVLLGGVQVVASNGAAADYARINQLARLSEQVGGLTHEISGERARLSWYIARGRPRAQLPDVRAQIGRSDAAIRELRGTANALLGGVTGRTADQIENMLNRFDDLGGLRDQAIEADLLPTAAVELYTTVINDLLSIHNELISGSQDDELFRQTRMLDALARAKESVSLQQALVTTALVEGSFGQEQLKTFLGELSREENQREAFAEEATADERRFFDETVNGRSADDMLFLRELVLIRATAGQTLRGLNLADRDDAGQWFEASATVIDALRTVEQRQEAGILGRSESLSSAEQQRAYVIAGAVIALLVAVLAITTGVARSLVRPLRRLRAEALEIAGKRLPDFVQHLRESRDGAVSAEVPPIGIFSRDEVGEVARAFDEVHREAVRLAGDEARLRANVNAMFVNLSRRSQTLVERQLTLIERLERGERDDDRLADLFKLDHLATRMRRNSENLLVLAGQEAARKWSQPVELMDVVRAALGEVESYDRVGIQVQSDAAIAGQAVNDVVHLLAELIENAVSFSSRDTKVVISSSRIDGGGLMVAVTDQGIGMSPEELSEANWRLANPPVVDVSVSRRMGLFVVGRLALRHSIKVQLRRQDVGGLTAMVLLPEMLLTPVPGAAATGTPFPPAASAQEPPPFAHVPMQASTAHPGIGHPSMPGTAHPSMDSAAESSWFSSSHTHSGDHVRGFASDAGPRGFLSEGEPGAAPRGFPQDGGSGPGSRDFAPDGGFRSGSRDFASEGGFGSGSRDFASDGGFAGGARGLGPDGGHGGELPRRLPTDNGIAAGGLPRRLPPEQSGPPAGPPSTSGEYAPLHASAEPAPAASSWFTKPDFSDAAGSPPETDAAWSSGDSWSAQGDTAAIPKVDLSTPPPAPPQAGAWSSPADQGWNAAGAAREPALGGLTSAGLPKRTPKANLVPGAAAPAPPPAPAPPVSPDRLRNRLSSYQQGVRKGRAELDEED